jgi:DNA segregation ATPase FtsK/SpoIIIE, S-DNA-T family
LKVQPEAGVKVSKIISLSDDLALNLAAPLVRIEAPIPGKAALGIEVPNKVISLVNLREVMSDRTFKMSVSPLTAALGKDITGIAVIADLTKMPHLLIAGATGAGKSVCLNTIITSILYKAGPDQVRFMMIDPKVVELSVYNGIPHLLMPVVTDPRKASLALRNMVREMGRRYDLFAKLGVRDIGTYNELTNEDSELEKLSYIVVIIDELADLMMVSPGEVEDSIARLAQMSRAAGIHLIVATQRPSVDVLTGIIKANITSRVAFTVSSQFDSRTILDMAGAEKLLGRGDMLFYPVGAVKPFRVQGAYISEVEVKKITDFIKEQGNVDYHESGTFLEVPEEADGEEADALFAEAIDLVVRTGQASISLLQRRFRIGYTRAARLIDDLERRGVVGPFEGSKPREVLVTQEQAEQICEEFNNRSE